MKILKFLIVVILIALLYVPLYADEPLAIRIENVMIDIEEGSILGSHRNGALKFYYNESLRYKSSFTENELKNTIEKLFVKKGFNIPGWGGPFRNLDKYIKPEFSFAVKINDLNFTWLGSSNLLNTNRLNVNNPEIKISTTWYIMHNASEQIIFSSDINSEYHSEEEYIFWGSITNFDFKFLIKKILDVNIDQLLRDQKYLSAISNVPAKAEIDPASFDKITLNKVPTPGTERARVLKKAQDASVTIVTATGHGSGFFIDHHGLILTCYHVVQQSNSVEVALNEGTLIKAKVVRTNPDYDLALIQIENVSSSPLGFSTSTVSPGDEVFAVGSPAHKDLGRSVTRGIVSAERVVEERQYVQTDASVSPGNSGGPLINHKGEVVGIVNAKAMSTGTEGVGFAIPVSVAMEKLNLGVKQ